jgi:hypothetical protein
MKIIKLNNTHINSVSELFDNVSLHASFCDTYLSNLQDFHAYGCIENSKITAFISFYESYEEPSWFWTKHRGDGISLISVLDEVIRYNERNGRLKFYVLDAYQSNESFWSKYNEGRYGYFDEFKVLAKNKCFYTNPWELLFNRTSINQDCIIRCNYLKQEYRTILPIGGNL